MRGGKGFGKLGAPSKAGSGSVVTAFSPLSLGSALVGWYDASVGVFKDAGTTLAVNNDTVQQWKDQSGHSRHLNQATAGKRPAFKTAGMNGKACVTFTAASATAMFASSFPITAGSGFSAVVVARMNSATDNYGRLLSYVSDTDGAGTGNDFAGPNNGVLLTRRSTSSDVEGFRDADLAIMTTFPGNAYRFGMTHDGTTFNTHLNNQTGDVFRGQSSAQTMCGASPGTLQVGSVLQVVSGVVQASSGNNWDGPVSEIVVVNRKLTDAEAAQLDVYLSQKWGMYVSGATGRNIIWDTDMDSDVGDAGAFQALIRLALNGECSIAAVLVSSRNTMAAETCRVILDANGLTSVPIGAYQGNTSTISNSDSFGTTVVARFGSLAATRGTFTDATTKFRQALAGLPDGSCTYVSVGYGPNLAGLLASSADGISALSGSSLFAAKVTRCVIAGGNYLSSNAEFNFVGDPADWNFVVANKPATVPFFYMDQEAFTTVLSHPAVAADPLVSPSKYAYTIAGDNQGGGVFTRPIWDHIATSWAVRGDVDGTLQVLGFKGSVAVNSTTGVSTYTGQSETGVDNVLYWNGTASAISTKCDALVVSVL